jgi:predicted Rossmann fold flavoprotein
MAKATNQDVYDVVIIGGGASGFFTAANLAMAKHRRLKIAIIEQQSKYLQKVKVSGGGRCNVTNACNKITDLLKKYPRGTVLLKHTLQQFNTQATIDWFLKNGVALKVESDGRIFPTTNNSQTIIDCLDKIIFENNVSVLLSKRLTEIKKQNGNYCLTLNNNEEITANKLVLASGGFKETSHVSNFFNQYSIEIIKPYPSLFTFNVENKAITQLAGISVDLVKIKIEGNNFVEVGPLLITHWGFSGPAAIRLSAWAAEYLFHNSYHFTLIVNWLHNKNFEELKNEFLSFRDKFGMRQIGSFNPFKLPIRLWHYILLENAIGIDLKIGSLKKDQITSLINSLIQNKFEIKGKTTFKEEFVTAGGVSLQELNLKTLELLKVPNVYCVGELVDVDGITGGYNFQHAWSSGYVAAQSILKKFD